MNYTTVELPFGTPALSNIVSFRCTQPKLSMPYLTAIVVVDCTHGDHIVCYVNQHMPCHVAIVYCNHIGPASASFQGLGKQLHRRTPQMFSRGSATVSWTW